LKFADPRVQTLCNVSGLPARCDSAHAVPIKERGMRSDLFRYYLSRLYPGAWLLLMDIDEFVSAPSASTSYASSVMSALQTFSHLGADLVNLPWRVYGPNRVKSNPTCAVQAMFPIPSRLSTCKMNSYTKPLVRLKPGMQLFSATVQNAHYLFRETRNLFGADGTNLSDCAATYERIRAKSGTRAGQNANCTTRAGHAPCGGCIQMMGNAPFPKARRPLSPMLELRHYITKSSGEYLNKTDQYRQLNSAHVSTRYSHHGAARLLGMLNMKFEECSSSRGCECAMESPGAPTDFSNNGTLAVGLQQNPSALHNGTRATRPQHKSGAITGALRSTASAVGLGPEAFTTSASNADQRMPQMSGRKNFSRGGRLLPAP